MFQENFPKLEEVQLEVDKEFCTFSGILIFMLELYSLKEIILNMDKYVKVNYEGKETNNSDDATYHPNYHIFNSEIFLKKIFKYLSQYNRDPLQKEIIISLLKSMSRMIDLEELDANQVKM